MFDFDGTLTEAGALDFAVIREAVGCPRELPILEFIETLESADARDRARQILDDYEIDAARRSQPNAGAEDVVRFLRTCGIKIGIVSRNSENAILTALHNFHDIAASDFDVILSRDDSLPPKPNPETILAAAEAMRLPPAEILVVGDFVFDVDAGYRAGAQTAFLTNRNPQAACAVSPDFIIHELSELREIVLRHQPLPPGKLPNALLKGMLEDLNLGDPSLLIAPGVGEDIAALRLDGEEVLVLKSDPITFATDAIAYYAVVVNANDVATCGASPRWFLSSLLFPPGTPAALIGNVIRDLNDVCRRLGLLLCGGHTEITDAVNRPVVAGQVAGTVTRSGLIDKRSMRPGDHILMTKAIAIEGTSIIAREFPGNLRQAGISPEDIERCRQFLADPGISILTEARIAASTPGISAMHDVTEGGLATALEEMSAAGLHRLRVYPGRIRVLEETMRICSALRLNPMGLIASGCLLIACRPDSSAGLVSAIRTAGIEAVCIGEVLGAGEGIDARDKDGNPAGWPRFRVDELARLFAALSPAPDSGEPQT